MANNLEFNHSALATARIEAGLSMRQLADKVGVVVSAVSKWESGEGSPSTKHLPVLAKALDVPVKRLTVRVAAFSGMRLTRLRVHKKHWSMRQLAAAMGVSVNAVSRWERGDDVPTEENTLRLSEILGIDVTDLYR